MRYTATVTSVSPAATVAPEIEVLIIGAGMAGLAAASELHRAGCHVRVLEKGRGVGGRLATRRIGSAAFDHGAQFMTARDPRLIARVEDWSNQGVVTEWCRGFSGTADGHPRWRGIPGMTAIAKRLAEGLDLRTETHVTQLTPESSGWRVDTKDGPPFRARAVILTAPVPQALALLDAGKVNVAPKMRSRLDAIRYERCLSVMATLAAPSTILFPGVHRFDEGPVAWLADNQRKGTSPEPAITLHATADFSLNSWDRDRTEIGRELLAVVRAQIGSPVLEFQVHGWRYSRPISDENCGVLLISNDPPLLLAGDAFAGPRIEGAVLSGWSAASALANQVS